MSALSKQSVVYSRRLHRCTLPCEALAVQGFKYFETADLSNTHAPSKLPPLTDNIFPQKDIISTLLDNQVRQAAGNAMHLSSVMAAICLIVACTIETSNADKEAPAE